MVELWHDFGTLRAVQQRGVRHRLRARAGAALRRGGQLRAHRRSLRAHATSRRGCRRPAPTTSARPTATATTCSPPGIEAFRDHEALRDAAAAAARPRRHRARHRLRQHAAAGPGAGRAHRRARVPRRQPQGRAPVAARRHAPLRAVRGVADADRHRHRLLRRRPRAASWPTTPTGPDGPAATYAPAPQHRGAARHRHGLPRRRPGGGRRQRARAAACPGMRAACTTATGGGRCGRRRARSWQDFGTDDLRYSVSWKAYCFADDAERRGVERPHRRPAASSASSTRSRPTCGRAAGSTPARHDRPTPSSASC